MTFPDERRYIMSWSFLKHLSQGDLQGSIIALFSADGRPGNVLVQTIPAVGQFLSAKIWGWEFLESQNSAPVFVYNFLIYSLIIYVLYKIYKLLIPNDTLVLFGLLVYSILINSFVYLRHIFPYNESLLVFLFVIWQMLKYKIEKQADIYPKKIILWSALAWTAYMIYPAYYLTYMAVFFLFNFLFLLHGRKSIRQVVYYNFIYLFTSFAIFILVEFLSGLGHRSYLKSLISLSKAVKQGSFSESYTFLFKYLFQVERIGGMLLILGIILFLFYLPSFIKQRKMRPALYLIVSFFIPYFLHTSMGYFFHSMTMYGRILHQFIPVVILMLLLFMIRCKLIVCQRIIVFLSLLISLEYFFQLKEYLQIVYPRDVYWQYLKTYPDDKIINLSTYKNAWSNLPERLEGKYIDASKKDSIYIVNGMFFYPYDTVQQISLKLPEKLRLIFDKLHFINYKAYQYEGLNIEERKRVDSLNFHIQVYR